MRAANSARLISLLLILNLAVAAAAEQAEGGSEAGPALTLGELVQLLFSGRDRKRFMLEMKQAMDRAPRPWLK